MLLMLAIEPDQTGTTEQLDDLDESMQNLIASLVERGAPNIAADPVE